jgi:hypothetical protein
MKKFLFLLSLSFLLTVAHAQDTLPRVSVASVRGNVLISWINPYSNLVTINIQRSYDSVSFTTIGSVINVASKGNGFLDQKPKNITGFYRLFLAFEGGEYMFTKARHPVIDSSKVIPQKPKQPEVSTWFAPSKYVYTGRENNVIINLPDAEKKHYHLKFFEDSGALLFELHKITEPYLILEKVHFAHAGIFRFELYDGGELIETHKFYIPKEPKVSSK